MTQQEMAREILVPRVTYTHYELGKRTPDLDTIIRIARYHAVSVDFLVGNSDWRSTLDCWLKEHDILLDANGSHLLYPISETSGERVADAPADD